jgi:L-seryl-tRNA(Ser) seleniumtransferase
MATMIRAGLRSLPSVDRVVARLNGGVAAADRALATDIAREVLEELRTSIAAGADAPELEAIVATVAARATSALAAPLAPLINATGVILHTNLGRAPLAREAIGAMAAVAEGYSDLEFDLASGTRGSRHDILEPLLCRITGAEAAMAVNNNAAAVLLALSALAAGKDVIVSRGQLVEIGGGFRVPDVMRQSRAKLVEVGTTNRTRASDYEAALTARTAAIMRVHPSNFRVVGFTESTTLEELVAVAHGAGVPVIDDIGSGCLLDTTAYGLPAEPTPQASIAAGADGVMFSGDKLLGGPQGGLIAGRRSLIARMKKHPLARAVRLDKASIAGLAATLRIYLKGDAAARIPVWQMISMPLAAIDARAVAMAAAIRGGASVIDGRSMIGGGSLPEESLPTRLVARPSPPGAGAGATAIAAALRRRRVVARVEDGRVLIDPRTMTPAEDEQVIAAAGEALGERAR